MAACLTFVFLGLVEFAYVNVLTRVETRRIQTKSPNEKVEEEDANSVQEYPVNANDVICIYEKYLKKTRYLIKCKSIL